MRAFFIRCFLALLIVSASACGKSDPAANAVPAAPTKSTASNVAAPSGPATDAQPSTTSSDANAQKPTDAETSPTERVAEVEEGAEADEPPAKGAPVLKLAQISRTATSSKFKEGANYLRLSPTQSVDVSPDQVQIAEIFWYGCPHCNALDPMVEAWRKSTQPGGKPAYVVFTRIPAAWNEVTRFHGRFYFAAESLGKLDELHPLIFREIHEKGNPLNTIDKAREFFVAHGVDANDFQKNFGAMTIERKLDNALLLAQRYRATGVPHFVVNGKYTTDVPMSGSPEQLFQLLNELAAREHAKD